MTQVKFITAEYSSHLEEKINKWLIHMNEKFDEFEVEDIKYINDRKVMIIFEV